MITLTPAAAAKIREAARESGAEAPRIRIAAQRTPEGEFQYAFGFDDLGIQEGDFRFNSEGIDIVVSRDSMPLLDGATLDFVEMEPGEFRFIFLNPNDPSYVPPAEGVSGG
jgi:iron-sulfur cluster assembly protein